jgi:hypothetical protein
MQWRDIFNEVFIIQRVFLYMYRITNVHIIEAAVSRVLLTTVAVWTVWITENLLAVLRPELQFMKPVACTLNYTLPASYTDI